VVALFDIGGDGDHGGAIVGGCHDLGREENGTVCGARFRAAEAITAAEIIGLGEGYAGQEQQGKQ